MSEVPATNLSDLIRSAEKVAQQVQQTRGETLTIAFFDLVGSTPATLEIGNLAASGRGLRFTALVDLLAREFGGQLVKALGDGAFACFSDPMSACRAALNLRFAAGELGFEMTAGITIGSPMRIDLDGGRFDLVGDAVNRAARIQGLAVPGQVLIDETLHSVVRADLAAETDWEVDDRPRISSAKGLGELRLYEVCLPDHWGLKRQLASPFQLSPDGRPSVAEKIALLDGAKKEILEIGVGLTSFAQYFIGQRPDEFRDPIREHVRRGVHLKCFTVDPAYEPGRAWLREQGDRDYRKKATQARQTLEAEQRFYRQHNYGGKLSYFTYRRVPAFWCLGVDVDEPDGRMFFASYLMGNPRAENPVIRVSRLSNAVLYQRFLTAVSELRAASTEASANNW